MVPRTAASSTPEATGDASSRTKHLAARPVLVLPGGRHLRGRARCGANRLRASVIPEPRAGLEATRGAQSWPAPRSLLRKPRTSPPSRTAMALMPAERRRPPGVTSAAWWPGRSSEGSLRPSCSWPARSPGRKNTSSPDRCCSPSRPPGRCWPCSRRGGPISLSGGRSCPPAFMALAGVSILALAPTGNEAGWVWPPVGGRARGLDDRPRPPGSAQPYAGVAAVPRVRCAAPVGCRRQVRDVPRDRRSSDLLDAGPARRRRRPQAPHQLHRHRQPHRRARTRPGRAVDRHGLDRPRRRRRPLVCASTTGRAAAGANPPARRRTASKSPPTCTRCWTAPASTARTCSPVTRPAASTSSTSPTSTPTRSPASRCSTP